MAPNFVNFGILCVYCPTFTAHCAIMQPRLIVTSFNVRGGRAIKLDRLYLITFVVHNCGIYLDQSKLVLTA